MSVFRQLQNFFGYRSLQHVYTVRYAKQRKSETLQTKLKVNAVLKRICRKNKRKANWTGVTS